MKEDVDCLPMAKPDANNHRGYAVTACAFQVLRLLVVLIEGRDPSAMDSES